MNDKRVCFDFAVAFSNGGGIQGQEFRLDIDGDNISDEALARYIVSDLRLLMVGSVEILRKEVIREAHKGNLTGRSLASDGNRRIDLSHVIEAGMVTYKGLPGPIICDHLSREQSRAMYAQGTEFQIDRVEMVGNTGTYIDTPFHRYADGHDLAALALERVSNVPGIVVPVDWNNGRAITASAFHGRQVTGRAVLVHTGWDRFWRTDTYFEGHPHLTADAAMYLRDEGALLVGIDSFNIDDVSGRERPVHTILLAAEIPVVEHLTRLAALPGEGFRFWAVPPKIHEVGTFPVRAHAELVAA